MTTINFPLIAIVYSILLLIGYAHANPDKCKDDARRQCPLLFDRARSREVHHWNDESIWEVLPGLGNNNNNVVIPENVDIFLSECHLQNDQQHFDQVVVPSSSHLFITDFSIRSKLGKVIGKVIFLSEEECWPAHAEVSRRRVLDDPTKSPTRFPTQSPTKFPTTESPTNFPTDSPTKSPTRRPTNAPTVEGTNPVGNNNPVINGSANDAQAVATLVGTTVPFFGLGILFAGFYMVRQRRAWSLAKNQLNGSVIVDNNNNNNNNPKSKNLHVSTNNPSYQAGRDTESDAENFERNSQDIEAFPAPNNPDIDAFQASPFAFPGIPKSQSDGSPTENDSSSNARASGTRKTMNSLMAMVLKSRETAAYYKSPVENAEEEEESGLSKQEIEEKVKRMAAAGARGFGTTTSGIGLKPLGIALVQMKPKERESLKPSEVAQRESIILTKNESNIESLVYVARTSSVPQISAARPTTSQLGGGNPDWRGTTSTVDY